MQVLTGEGHDGCHWCDESGAYEWWYADARDAHGEWGAVVILFRGMPMSPDYLAAIQRGNAIPMEACGYSVSVYHRGKRIAMAFRGVPAEECAFNEVPDVTVGPVQLRYANGRLAISVDTFDPRAPQRVVLQLELAAPISFTDSGAPFSDCHGWVLAAPRLEGTMHVRMNQYGQRMVDRVIPVVGYHDHNMGRRAMHLDFGDWHWGRVHLRNATFVFLQTERFMWAATIDASGIHPWNEPDCRVAGWRFTLMGLRSPTALHINEGEGGHRECMIVHGAVLEDGPFYRRYASTFTFNDGQAGDGYAEYMNVRRFQSAWMRPFLRLPWLA